MSGDGRDELRERVARAIWNPAGDRDWWTVTEEAKEGYRRLADAAIDAIQPQTDGEATDAS